MDPLHFESLEFRGIDRMVPPSFDVNIRTYTVYRKAGNKLAFRAGLNRNDVLESYTLMLYVYGNMYSKSYWSPNSWAPFRLGNDDTEVVVGCELNSPMDGEKSQFISIAVITEPTEKQEHAECLHLSTYSSEGQCWGGGSGSSTVEIITYCAICNATLGTSHEHRD